MAHTTPAQPHRAREVARKASLHRPSPLVRRRPRVAPERGARIRAKNRVTKYVPRQSGDTFCDSKTVPRNEPQKRGRIRATPLHTARPHHRHRNDDDAPDDQNAKAQRDDYGLIAPTPPHHRSGRRPRSSKQDTVKHAPLRQRTTRTMPPQRTAPTRPDHTWRKCPHARHTPQPAHAGTSLPWNRKPSQRMQPWKRRATQPWHSPTWLHDPYPNNILCTEMPSDDAARNTHL